MTSRTVIGPVQPRTWGHVPTCQREPQVLSLLVESSHDDANHTAATALTTPAATPTSPEHMRL